MVVYGGFTNKERAWMAEQYGIENRMLSEIATEIETNPSTVSQTLVAFCREMGHLHLGADLQRVAVRGLVTFLKTGGRPQKPIPRSFDRDIYARARWEHAWLLRCEGKSSGEIGDRLGVEGQTARLLVLRFGPRMARAMRRTRFQITEAS